MSPDLITQAVSLGPAGLAMVLAWQIFKECMRRLDKKDQELKELHTQVLGEVSATLIAATATNKETTKVLERVINHLDKN